MDDDQRWYAIVARDPTADGKFILCVKTTMIFCRPICKARLARRSNVEFYDTVAEAQAAGYRACKRCKPLLATYTPEADKIKKACDLLDALPQDAPLPGLERLAKEAGLSKHHFHRLFKRETGLTPREYALSRRSESSSESSVSATMSPISPLTNNMDTPIIADDDLFSTLNFDPVIGEMKDIPAPGYDPFTVFYNIIETSYGYLLVAFHENRVCKLELGQTEAELQVSLESSFPSIYYLYCPVDLAEREDAAAFRQQISALVEALENPSGKVLDIAMPLSFADLPTST